MISTSIIPAERRKLLFEWNKTEADYPRDLCIHQLFEAQVERDPSATAVLYENNSLTYEELNAQANRLARHLISVGVTPDSRVAICVERSIEMMIGLIAILKAGGAYVPLDPAYPPERLAHMLRDSAPVIVLTHGPARARLDAALAQICAQTTGKSDEADQAGAQFSNTGGLTGSLIDLGADAHNWSNQHDGNSNPQEIDLTSQNLAYVIYTSGSTGKPKGVMIEHKCVVNLLHSIAKSIHLQKSAVLMALTSISFDIAGLELFLPLTAGAAVFVASCSLLLDSNKLGASITDNCISIIQATPAMWRSLIETGWKPDVPLTALCGGEALPNSLARLLVSCCGTAWNLYGPTETTIWSSIAQLEMGDSFSPPPIGRPISNTRIHILDNNLSPVPIGMTGEIYIGGAGVARGYLNRPDLTAERFIADPFVKGDRIYRTGDLARYLPDGNIEFLGRNDFQVKIRGFRIELGEIEARLLDHPGVREAVIIAREDGGDKRLVAYYTAMPSSSERGKGNAIEPNYSEVLGAEELRQSLAGALPEYMLPAAYVRLDTFPLTPNGKLDRKALPAPGGDAYAKREYEDPIGTIEIALALIWTDVLKVERVGRHDNFFDLGGHSLPAMQITSRVRELFDVMVSIATVFNEPTIELYASALQQDGLLST